VADRGGVGANSVLFSLVMPNRSVVFLEKVATPQ